MDSPDRSAIPKELNMNNKKVIYDLTTKWLNID